MQTFAVILLVILLAFLLLGGCKLDPDLINAGGGQANLEATAEFGAKEFHAQLTAIAVEPTSDCLNTNGCDGVTK